MEYPLVLVGPIGAGKGTVAKLLSARLGVQEYALDRLEADYAARAGMDFDQEDALVRGDDFEAYVRFLRPYSYATLEGALREPAIRDGVAHCGALHVFAEAAEDWERVKHALDGILNVILLLPSPDIEESVGVLAARLVAREANARDASPAKTAAMLAVNERITRALPVQGIATMTVHTEGKTPEEVADEIIARAR